MSHNVNSNNSCLSNSWTNKAAGNTSKTLEIKSSIFIFLQHQSPYNMNKICLWQGCSSTRHLSGFPWAPPTQDTGRCSTKMFNGVNRQMVFAELVVYWSWLSPLLECVCWWLVYPGVPWLLMHPRCAAPPSQSPISLTQARWGCKPAINNTHPPQCSGYTFSLEKR